MRELDKAGTAYTVMIPGVTAKHCGVLEHWPDYLIVREYVESGHFVDHFVNLTVCKSVEVEVAA